MKKIIILAMIGMMLSPFVQAQSQEKKDFRTAVLDNVFNQYAQKDGYTYVYAQKDAIKDAISSKTINEFDEIAFVKVLTYEGARNKSQVQSLEKFRYTLQGLRFDLVLKMNEGGDIHEVYQRKGENSKFDKVFINGDGGSLTFVWVSGTIAKE